MRWPRRGPKSPDRTLDELIGDVQLYVGEIAATLDPDEDWLPGVFVSGPKRGTAIAVFDPAFEPDELADAVDEFAAAQRAERLVFWATSWVVMGDDVDATTRPSESPSRFEAVALQAKEGPRHEVWHARVERRPGLPPRLGEWEQIAGESETVEPYEPLR